MKNSYTPAELVNMLTDRESVERCAEYEADHVTLEEYWNAFTPGMSREEANKQSGYFSYTSPYGSCAPVLRCSDWEGDEELTKIAEEYGFVEVSGTWDDLAAAAQKRLAEMDAAEKEEEEA